MNVSTFLDSNVFIAFVNTRDRDHVRALALMERVRRGEFGQPYTSDYVFDEALTTTLIRTRRPQSAINAGKLILGASEEGIPALFRLLRVDERIFAAAWTAFKTGRFTALNFTDHTILAHVKAFNLDYIASFDTGFDGLAPPIT